MIGWKTMPNGLFSRNCSKLRLLIRSLSNPRAVRHRNIRSSSFPIQVFGAANISNLSALADTLNAGQDREAWKATDNAMYRYAAYHFLSGAYSTNDFVKVDTTSTSSQVLILETLSEADFLEFQSIESNFYINYDTASMSGVQFLETTNLLCKNGMIHTVDAPMYIKAPSTIPATTWELTDYDVLAREIPEYRLSSLTFGIGLSSRRSSREIRCFVPLSVADSRFPLLSGFLFCGNIDRLDR